MRSWLLMLLIAPVMAEDCGEGPIAFVFPCFAAALGGCDWNPIPPVPPANPPPGPTVIMNCDGKTKGGDGCPTKDQAKDAMDQTCADATGYSGSVYMGSIMLDVCGCAVAMADGGCTSAPPGGDHNDPPETVPEGTGGNGGDYGL